MSRTDVAINSDYNDLGWREDAGERAWLLQSPSVESEPKSDSKEPTGGTSSIGAVFIVVNAALGAGLLNFPAAFNTAGGVTCGVVLQMCMLVFIIAGLVVLAYCSQVSNESTYQEVVRAVCGRVPGVLCDVAIAVYTFGTCIAFLIIIGDQLDKRESSPRDHHQAFNCVIQYLKPVRREELAPGIDYAMQFTERATCLPAVIGAMAHESEGEVSTSWYTDRKFTISLTSILLILPLSIPKEIGFQKYASALSVIGTWYVTIVIIIKYIWPDKEITPGYIPTSPSSWTAVFNAMPTICFGFQCHVSSVPVFNSMKRPEIRPWGCVVTVGMIICLFVYTGTGVCGFLTFGSNVNQDVLLSYPSNDIPVAVARAFIVVCVLTSYPILHFCGRAVLEGLWLRFRGEPVEVDVTRERRRRVLQTVVWFSLTLLLALFIPDIGRVISLIGGLAACFIFIFPGLCLIQAKLSEIQEVKPASWWALVSYGIFMVTLGAFIFGQTTTNAIYRDVIHQNTE